MEAKSMSLAKAYLLRLDGIGGQFRAAKWVNESFYIKFYQAIVNRIASASAMSRAPEPVERHRHFAVPKYLPRRGVNKNKLHGTRAARYGCRAARGIAHRRPSTCLASQVSFWQAGIIPANEAAANRLLANKNA